MTVWKPTTNPVFCRLVNGRIDCRCLATYWTCFVVLDDALQHALKKEEHESNKNEGAVQHKLGNAPETGLYQHIRV